jgi:hypothetical protein
MRESLSNDNAELLKKYCDLAEGVRMIRHAVDKAFCAGLVPYERIGITPLEECHAIARAIHGAIAKKDLPCEAPSEVQMNRSMGTPVHLSGRGTKNR